MILSIPQRVIAEKILVVNYLKTRDLQGKSHYFYIAVKATNIQKFKNAISNPPFDPQDLGMIIEEGFGEPDEMTKERMRIQYGCNHEYAVDMPLDLSNVEAV